MGLRLFVVVLVVDLIYECGASWIWAL